jgi:Protein of unknown function (DUF2855)
MPSTRTGQTFLVQRDALMHTRTEPIDLDTPPAPGCARLAIECFAFTANNITYAVFGDSMHYWRFFPADAPWGCIPVWGFATVEASAVPGLAVGERIYGYWPMASHATVRPVALSAHGFTDGSAHRAELPSVYNRYQRVATRTDVAQDGAYAVLRPLFATAWLIDDFFAEADDFGARHLLLSSASSKTALATAFCLRRRTGAPRVVGLTSVSRLGYVQGLGVYDQVLTYDALDSIDANDTVAYIDFAGDAPLRRAVHERFASTLAFSSSIGGTHHDALGGTRGLPGPKPELFFAPAQMQKRQAPPPQGLGREGLMAGIDATWGAFVARATQPGAAWIEIESRRGSDAVREAYLQTLHGQGDPRRGLMLAL